MDKNCLINLAKCGSRTGGIVGGNLAFSPPPPPDSLQTAKERKQKSLRIIPYIEEDI